MMDLRITRREGGSGSRAGRTQTHTHTRARGTVKKKIKSTWSCGFSAEGGWTVLPPLPRASHLLSLGSESFVETLPSVPFSQKRTSLSYAALNLCTKRSFSSSWGLLP